MTKSNLRPLLKLALLLLTAAYMTLDTQAQESPEHTSPRARVKVNPLSPLINYYSEIGVEYGLDKRRSISTFVGYVGLGLLSRPLSQATSDTIGDGATVRRRIEETARGPYITASYRQYLNKGAHLSDGYEQPALEGVYLEGQLRMGHLTVEERSTTYDFSGPDFIEYKQVSTTYSALTISLGSQTSSGPLLLDFDVSGGIGYSSNEELIMSYFSPVLGAQRWSTQWNIRCRLGLLSQKRKNQK